MRELDYSNVIPTHIGKSGNLDSGELTAPKDGILYATAFAYGTGIAQVFIGENNADAEVLYSGDILSSASLGVNREFPLKAGMKYRATVNNANMRVHMHFIPYRE